MSLVIQVKNPSGNLYNVHITTFGHPYPNMADILINEYNMRPEDKILVKNMRVVDRPTWKRWRCKPKKMFFGTVEDFKKYSRELCEKTIWKKRKNKEDPNQQVEAVPDAAKFEK